MATIAQEQSLSAYETRTSRAGGWASGVVGYMRRNPELIVGLCLLLALVVFVAVGHLFVNLDKARPLSGRPLLRRRLVCRSVPTNRVGTCWR